jgi:hypothetical protein
MGDTCLRASRRSAQSETVGTVEGEGVEGREWSNKQQKKKETGRYWCGGGTVSGDGLGAHFEGVPGPGLSRKTRARAGVVPRHKQHRPVIAARAPRLH